MFEGRNVHFSTDNKPLCSFSGKLCKLRRLNGYAFCVRHILEDPTAPFRQCAYVVKSSGQKCTSAIPVTEERQYCNAHMQVMGFLPKKERKKKVDSTFLADTEAGIQNLENCSGLINGLNEDGKSSKSFSASKLFPELAGKLSIDNHIIANTNGQHNGSTTANELAESVIKDGMKPLNKSPSKSTTAASTPRRQKKQTKKFLSIQRKKQLGLLTNDEAKAKFSSTGCQAYNHYATMRTYDSDLLTPIVESSDDELPCSSSIESSYVRSHILKKMQGSSRSSNVLISPSPDTDLNSTNKENDSPDPELLYLKQCCLSLRCSTYVNKDVVDYQRIYMKYILETLKADVKSGEQVVLHVREPDKQKSNCSQSSNLEKKSNHVIPRAREKKTCTYTNPEDGRKCPNPAVPFSNHCISHISLNVDQCLFSLCSHKLEDDNHSCFESCSNFVVDTGHGTPLCSQHTPHLETAKLEDSRSLVPVPKRVKKKSKSFALLKSNKKKRRKGLRPQKPVPTLSSESKSLYSTRHYKPSMEPVASAEGDDSKKSESKVEEGEGEDSNVLDDNDLMSPLDKSLELPLDQADSKLLLEKDFEDVLNDENFALFTGKHDESLGLTEAEADLILSATDNAMMDEIKSELPDDITDTILHVESEQAALEQNQQQQQQQHNIPTQQHVQTSHHHHHHHMNANSSYSGPMNIANSINPSFNKSDYGNMPTPYEHQGPPPDYPGSTSMLPSVSHMHHHGNHISYMREQATPNYPHQLHPKLSMSSSQNSNPQHNHMMMGNTNYHVSGGTHMALPPSSTLLDNNHQPSVSRMDRLPPVSTITMQQWPGTETHYQNGYHNPIDQLFIQNGLSSPPQYHPPRDQRVVYSNMYNSSPYSLNHPPNPHPPPRINMPLQ